MAQTKDVASSRTAGSPARPAEARQTALDEELAYAIISDAPLDVIREIESRIRATGSGFSPDPAAPGPSDV